MAVDVLTKIEIKRPRDEVAEILEVTTRNLCGRLRGGIEEIWDSPDRRPVWSLRVKGSNLPAALGPERPRDLPSAGCERPGVGFASGLTGAVVADQAERAQAGEQS